jgi:hypothetical protein
MRSYLNVALREFDAVRAAIGSPSQRERPQHLGPACSFWALGLCGQPCHVYAGGSGGGGGSQVTVVPINGVAGLLSPGR